MKKPKVNFSGISSEGVIGKLLRYPLSLIPINMKMPILQGQLRGYRWIAGSSNHGCWLGSYEHKKQILFANIVSEGSVVYDIGAHVGFYTLLASKLVGPGGIVLSFEPLPRNANYLKKHLRLNCIENVKFIQSAVSDKSGTAFFEEQTSSYMGSLSSKGGVEVKTICLDDLVARVDFPAPEYMKIDVEGSEFSVLKGAKSILADNRPTIFLATHGHEVHKQCCEFLKSMDYQLRSVNEQSIDQTDEILAIR
jgi:FkbM family methyltransferase